MKDLIITQALKEDLPAILDVQRKAFGEVARIFCLKSMPQLEQTLENMTAEFNKMLFLNAFMDGEIVGSVRGYCKDGTCYIHRLIVLSEYQNKGIGKALIHAIEEHFQNKATRYELFTGAQDQRNLYFYNQLGYDAFRTEKHNDEISFVYLEKSVKD